MKKILLCFVSLFIAGALYADIAPKPQIIYNFKYLTNTPLTIDSDSSEQIQCADNQCLNPTPLGIYGIQKFDCDTTECYALAYEFLPFQKLIIKFSDGITRESPVFRTPSELRSAMQVNVKDNALEMVTLPQTPATDKLSKGYMVSSFIITMALELIACTLYLLIGGLPLTILIYIAAANAITIPFNWWVLSNLIPNTGVLWTAAFIFELLFLYLLNTKRLSFKDAFGLVMIANVTSYAVGMMILFALASM